MKKYIPYEKLSKKERKKIDASRRGTWGAVNPVTRMPENSRAYNRKKAQKRSDLLSVSALFMLPLIPD